MPAPEIARNRAANYLTAVDQALPGLVSGLYLTGSVALGDFRPGRSDVDTVVVVSRPLGPADLDALEGVHAGLPRDPVLDGVYVTASDLATPPGDGQAATFVVNGEFRRESPCGELNPVLWLTVITHGIAVRGAPPAALGIQVEPARLREYNRDNLRSYWLPLAGQFRDASAADLVDAVHADATRPA